MSRRTAAALATILTTTTHGNQLPAAMRKSYDAKSAMLSGKQARYGTPEGWGYIVRAPLESLEIVTEVAGGRQQAA